MTLDTRNPFIAEPWSVAPSKLAEMVGAPPPRTVSLAELQAMMMEGPASLTQVLGAAQVVIGGLAKER